MSAIQAIQNARTSTFTRHGGTRSLKAAVSSSATTESAAKRWQHTEHEREQRQGLQLR
jgi:hypothetical protein